MAAQHEIDRLAQEHLALMRAHAQAQERCSALLRAQAGRIAAMAAQLIRAEAARVRAETSLAWEREDRAALEASIPGLGRRVLLGRRIEALQTRVHDLTRALHQRELAAHNGRASRIAAALPERLEAGMEAALEAGLEASLDAADLVICQTGCMSHGDYWRVQDHCKRTGKLCVLVDQPDGLQIVRIHRTDDALAR